ncbi:hypothetical protein OESDEN_22281 [Oesophagostomum dentatum]|uniref:Uncharacterized protein n=1 Tax=Oesophagostomum dentatum TaxID=61180 RepID=A0A0B1RZK4_OESDE|nr:hypothetical protein OESDEN_22281 [Oesophagostomum dentatum]
MHLFKGPNRYLTPNCDPRSLGTYRNLQELAALSRKERLVEEIQEKEEIHTTLTSIYLHVSFADKK